MLWFAGLLALIIAGYFYNRADKLLQAEGKDRVRCAYLMCDKRKFSGRIKARFLYLYCKAHGWPTTI